MLVNRICTSVVTGATKFAKAATNTKETLSCGIMGLGRDDIKVIKDSGLKVPTFWGAIKSLFTTTKLTNEEKAQLQAEMKTFFAKKPKA